MTSKCKKSQIWPFRPWKITFRAIQPNLSFDMWFMSPKRSFMPKKKKSYWSVSEIDPSPPQSWRTDGQTDGQTDRRTTDKSVLEKLRCLSAGGAKNTLATACQNQLDIWTEDHECTNNTLCCWLIIRNTHFAMIISSTKCKSNASCWVTIDILCNIYPNFSISTHTGKISHIYPYLQSIGHIYTLIAHIIIIFPFFLRFPLQ